jgi:ABC-type glycerol-3-phosphate transport system permease component
LIRRLVRNKKGIDTILASLLMVVIVVAASVMVFVYATGLFGALMQAPNTQKEALSLELANFQPANKTVSLYMRNTGSAPITLISYYVKDAGGNQYARTGWANQQPVAPTAFGNLTLFINSACNAFTPPCTLTGTAFTFQSGNAYTIVVLSSRGSQFTFSVLR